MHLAPTLSANMGAPTAPPHTCRVLRLHLHRIGRSWQVAPCPSRYGIGRREGVGGWTWTGPGFGHKSKSYTYRGGRTAPIHTMWSLRRPCRRGSSLAYTVLDLALVVQCSAGLCPEPPFAVPKSLPSFCPLSFDVLHPLTQTKTPLLSWL